MLVTYSKDLSDQFKGIAGDWRINAIELTGHLAKTRVLIKWAKADNMGVNRVRFELPDANDKAHDTFISAVYNLDPWAIIKTARATYQDAEDFLIQKASRLPARVV